MTKAEGGRQRVIEALVSAERERERVAFGALCERLVIDPDQPEPVKWMLIGIALAKEQPEFNGRHRRKGGQKIGPFQSIDFERAKLVFEYQSIAKRSGQRPSIPDAIKALIGESPRFPAKTAGIQSLMNSVSRGNKTLGVGAKRRQRRRRRSTP